MRFVSTPEILERFIALEKEISQIESSVQSNELEKAHVSRQGEQGTFDLEFSQLKYPTQNHHMVLVLFVNDFYFTRESYSFQWQLSQVK